MIDVLIPTIGRGTICSTITALLSSEKVTNFIILDSGEEPIIGSSEVRIMFDLCARLNKPVKYIREQCSIGKARATLIKASTSDLALFIDDDVIFEGSQLDWMAFHFVQNKELVSYCTPCNWIVTDFLGVEGLDRSPKKLEEIQSIVGDKDWMFPYFVYDDEHEIKISSCGTQCLLFPPRDVSTDTLNKLSRWKMGYPREDTLLTSSLYCGLVYTKYTSWHLQTVGKRVEWGKKDTELGYRSVLAGETDFFTGKE